MIKISSGQTQSAVLEYQNSEITDGVVSGMNNLDVGGLKLFVQRVPISSADLLLKPTSVTKEKKDVLEDLQPTSVIRLSNMTTEEDLKDSNLYEELIEDVADECNNHGVVKDIKIPRGAGNFDPSDPSVGKIFVHFTDADSAEKAMKAVSGRKFNGQTVVAHFYPEDLFLDKVAFINFSHSI